MSKAFTRESDSEGEPLLNARALFTLPPGAKNYMTPGGALRLKNELATLIEVERPRAASSPDRQRDLAEVDQRITYLEQSLGAAEIVQPPKTFDGLVRFGATVTVRDKAGGASKYRIVGIDEMDADRGWVSWRSPVARALLNKRVGAKIRFAVPEGERDLEIIEVSFEND
ncbi:MAG: Transcription elongation factor GreB [Verrucomicrobiales bacterium]|nr:Transcription elongation factor GreB [Verrucomicrobiales bacterium]